MVEDKSLESLLEELGANPRDTTQFKALCDLYAAAEPEQRAIGYLNLRLLFLSLLGAAPAQLDQLLA